jgi:hypothetical protein
MPTKRTPISRPARGRITPEVLDLFAKMQTLSCKRPPARYECGCADCREWERLHRELWDALGGQKPWHRSCVVTPCGIWDESSKRMTAELEAALAEREAR